MSRTIFPPGSSPCACKLGGSCSNSIGNSINSRHGHFTLSFFQWRIKPKAQHILGKRSATELHPSLVVLFCRSTFHTSILKTKRSSSVLPTLNTLPFFLLSAVLGVKCRASHPQGKHSTTQRWPWHPNLKALKPDIVEKSHYGTFISLTKLF